jgi:hypothetical protein
MPDSDPTIFDADDLEKRVIPRLWSAWHHDANSIMSVRTGRWGQVLALGNSAGGTKYALIGRKWNDDRSGWVGDWRLLATPETTGGALAAVVDYATNGDS